MARAGTALLDAARSAVRRARGLGLVAIVVSTIVLTGCAATNVVSQVSSYGPWPEARKPGAYVFERLPSQAVQAADQARLEAAAEPALLKRGFHRVEQPEKAAYTVQIDAGVRTEPRVRYDPVLVPYGMHPGYVGAGYPYFWRPGVGGWWGSGGSGLSLSLALDPPWVTLEVRLLIRDRRDGRVLYETQAAHDRVGSVDEAVLPFVFEAALDGFPQPPRGRRVVTVPLPEAGR
jgi:hypothetical protein